MTLAYNLRNYKGLAKIQETVLPDFTVPDVKNQQIFQVLISAKINSYKPKHTDTMLILTKNM